MGNPTDDLKSETRPLVLPRMPICAEEEIRVRLDVDPEGYLALRVDVFVGDDSGGVLRRGPIWVNPHSLTKLSADLEF